MWRADVKAHITIEMIDNGYLLICDYEPAMEGCMDLKISCETIKDANKHAEIWLQEYFEALDKKIQRILKEEE